MRTTVDLDPRLLERAKRLAASEGRTLGAVLGAALAAYLGSRRKTAKDPPFQLLVRGSLKGHFPTPAEIASVEEQEDVASLALSPRGDDAPP